MHAGEVTALRHLLRFYAEAGVTALVDEHPVDRRAAFPGERTEAGTAAPAITPERTIRDAAMRPPLPAAGAAFEASVAASPPVPPEEAVMAAREAAAAAGTLDELRAIMTEFRGCALHRTAKQLVFADGNPAAPLMLVGEAPGREEDLTGLPFVGRSGQLLDRMLAAIGLDRTGAYIANIIPWRPPGNRTPTPQEAAICMPFILRQIELVRPRILVCLGGPSAAALLHTKEGIVKSRGRWFACKAGSVEVRALPTFHPAYLLRQPLQKRQAWRDLLAVQAALAETPDDAAR